MRPRALSNDIVGDGDPVVLVPGGLTGWLSWVPHQERLGDRYRVIRVQPIHNELGSAGVVGDPSYTRDVERESLRMTLDELGIDRADFAGWSNGGRALIEFTLAYPERVRSLTLVEPAAHWILSKLGDGDPELDRFIDHLYGVAGKEITDDHLALFLASAGFVADESVARDHPFWERAYPHRMALSWISDDLMGSDHSPDDLRSITCPVLLTKGTVTAAYLKRVVDVVASMVPRVRVVELEGGHAHHIESIDGFLAEFEAHLDGTPEG